MSNIGEPIRAPRYVPEPIEAPIFNPPVKKESPVLVPQKETEKVPVLV